MTFARIFFGLGLTFGTIVAILGVISYEITCPYGEWEEINRTMEVDKT